jgi:hypothetical protein
MDAPRDGLASAASAICANLTRPRSTNMTIELSLLVALSRASAYALYPLIALYFLVTLYAVFAGWPRFGERRQVRLLWLIVLPTAVFIALWLCGRMIMGLLLWLWPGERYLGLAIWLAGFVALLVSLTLFVRMATGRASRRYVQVISWGAGLCAGLYGAVLFIEFAGRIDGWTARGALENKYEFVIEGSEQHPPHLPRRIVDETTPVVASRGGKAFAIYVDDVRVLEARVMPRYRWWWAVSYSKYSALGVDMPVEEQLRRLKESLKKRRSLEKK